MNPTLIALTGFTGWTLLLTFALLNMRGYYAFLSKEKIALNNFSPDGKDLAGFGQRLTRAHLNCLEMLPSFAALVLVAYVSEQLVIMETSALYLLYARVAQSTVHLISTSIIAVLLRAIFWAIQLVLLLFYTFQLSAPFLA